MLAESNLQKSPKYNHKVTLDLRYVLAEIDIEKRLSKKDVYLKYRAPSNIMSTWAKNKEKYLNVL